MKLKYETRAYGENHAGTAGWTVFATAAKTRAGIESAMLKHAKDAYSRHLSMIERGFIEPCGIWEFHSYASVSCGVLRYFVWIEDGAPLETARIVSWQPSDGDRAWTKAAETKERTFASLLS